MYLDNRRMNALPALLLRNHFFLEVNGVRLCYCYLRKNASSSFKKLFMNYSPYSYSSAKYAGKLDFFRKKHGALLPVTRHEYDVTIVVLRHPIKRAVSLFVNKVVEQTFAADFSKNYQQITGRLPTESSFYDFVVNYLDNPWWKLDLHVWPQSKQLWPITYTHALMDEELTKEMSTLLGPEITEEYFSGTINASTRGRNHGIENILERPAYELGTLLGHYDLTTDLEKAAIARLERKLKEIYKSDYDLLERFPDCPPTGTR